MGYNVMFVGAHPDDIFLTCGGTIGHLIKQGANCSILTMTSGSFENLEKEIKRKNEFRDAANAVGANHKVLTLVDTQVAESIEAVEILHSELVENSPSLIFTHSNYDHHPDHYNTSRIVDAAVARYYLRNGVNQTKKLKGILHFPPARLTTANFHKLQVNFYVDISNYISLKSDLIAFHKSQHPGLTTNLKKHQMLNSFLGALVGCDSAEGFYFSESSIESGLLTLQDLYGGQ